MSKIKCSISGCNQDMDIDKHEVYAARFVRTSSFNEDGSKKEQPEFVSDGHRFVCKHHYTLIKKRKLKPTLELIYGRKKQDGVRFQKRNTEQTPTTK